MTLFIVLCALMAVLAIAVIALPLLRTSPEASQKAKVKRPIVTVIVIAVLIPAIAAGLYTKLSEWDWNNPQGASAPQAPNVDEMVAKLEQRLQKSPDDIDGWLMLGRSYVTLKKLTQAVAAYEKAYQLGGETHTQAALGLAEALMMSDQAALEGRAGDLFESVLKREPGNVTALWYGAITALTRGNAKQGRQRIETLLSMNPPEKVRMVLERQLQDIDQQMGVTAPNAASTNAAASDKPQRQITVKVSLSASMSKGLDPHTPLFILARNGAGPPLAAVRRAVGDLPLTVTLSDRDAMIAGRSIATVAKFDVVARISKSGAPQAQSGDLFGEAHYQMKTPTADVVEIVINSTAP